jgi:hypothetical protein
MSSVRRSAPAALAMLAALMMIIAAPGRALADPVLTGPRLFVVAMPRVEAEAVMHDAVVAVGLGVFPDSRSPERFIREVGYGAPVGRGSAEELGGSPGNLGRALSSGGLTVGLGAGGPAAIRAALEFAFGPKIVPTAGGDDPTGARQIDVVVLSIETRSEFDDLTPGFPGPMVVLGVGARTPVLVGVVPRYTSRGGIEQRGRLLSGGIARRPGIVTPYDLTRLIVRMAGVGSNVLTDGFVGKPLTFSSVPEGTTAISELGKIEERMTLDAEVGHAVGGVTVPMSIAAAALGVGLVWLGRNRWAIRAGLAAWAANAGYIIALFVPTSSGALRALIMLAAMAAAAALPVRGSPKVAARYAFAITAVFWLAALLAPLRPGGLPGAAIWGNPLVSWRFFGLQNFEAGLIACGVVVWGVIAGFGARVLAALAVLAGIVIAAPTIGANYVGLLTFAFGAALAVLALVRKRVEVWHIFAAGAIASAGFVASLIADTGSPVSHGGRAAERISQGGLSVLWEFVRRRMRLNLDLIRTFPLGTGFVLMAAMIVVVFLMFRWSLRSGQRWPGAVAVWAGAAMALASMVLEDSGFYSGAIIFVIVATGYIVASGETAAISSVSPAPPGDGG